MGVEEGEIEKRARVCVREKIRD